MLSYKQYLMEMAAAAYHGSPHDFDKFKKEHIGSGEGNQAYGYGLYFADAKEVAEWYRDKLSQKNGISVSFKDKKITEPDEKELSTIEYLIYLTVENFIRNGFNINKARRDAIAGTEAQYDKLDTTARMYRGQGYDDDAMSIEKKRDEIGAIIDEFESFSNDDFKIDKGHLYHVILQPDEDEYLLWDEPLNKQSDKVKELIEDRIVGYGNGEHDEYLDSTLADIYDMDLVDDPTLTGRDLYEKLSYNNNKQSDKRASEYLHSIGIRGIKYLDGTSRSKGKGNYNYVIFDEDDVVLQSKE